MPTKSYDLNDPEDLARFHLNMLCNDVLGVIQDYTGRFGRDQVESEVLSKFAGLAVAVKHLNDVTAPKAVRPPDPRRRMTNDEIESILGG